MLVGPAIACKYTKVDEHFPSVVLGDIAIMGEVGTAFYAMQTGALKATGGFLACLFGGKK